MDVNDEIDNGRVSLVFSEDEALVLLEWLHRFNEHERPQLFQDQAEERILFDLEAELEKRISRVFSNDYQKVLLEARTRIRDKD